ncbi:hypothetical protein C8Q80DRAFT_1273962 [Daedaleopsis nitida]|nr:hypothetical protein C8Q80DRAFT_1273962 [Daedaleopsis nitida]
MSGPAVAELLTMISDSELVYRKRSECIPVFYIYESIITLGSEVEFFWGPKRTGAAILFLFSKYLSLINYLICLALYLSVFTDRRFVILHLRPSR